MHDQRRTQLIAYGVAVFATGLLLVIRLALVPWLGYHAELMTFFLAVIISAYLGGVGPGLLATALGVATGRYFFMEPRYSLAIHELGRAYAMGLFVLVSAVISGLMESLHRSRRRTEEEERSRAQQAVREAEQRFEHVAENMREIFWVTDLGNSRVMYVSPGYDQIWGRSAQSLYDQPRSWTESIHPDDRPGVVENLERRRRGVFNDLEFRIIRPDGSTRWIRNRAFPIRDAGGNPSRIAGLAEDITQLKLAEEELQRTTQLFQAVVDGTQDAVYVKDREGRHLMLNAAASRMVGKPIGEVLGRDDTAIWGADDARLVMAHDRRVMESGFPLTDEKALTASGVTRTYLASKAPYRDGKGNIIGIIGICHDITERKGIEEALRESEQRWRSLTEAMPQLVWTNKPDGSMDYASAQVWQYLGRPPSELLGWGWLEVLHPDDRERTEQAWRAAITGQSEYEIEHRLRRFDGTYRWFKTRGVPVRDGAGEIVKWFGTCTDITTNKQLEEALRQANARVELAVRSSDISIWECDMPDGRIQNAHLTLFNLWESLGYDARTMPTDFSSACAVFFHPDDLERVGREIQELLAGDGQEWKNEYRALTKDGSTRWLLARGTVLRDPDGKPVRFIGTSTDITDRKRAEEALRETGERFRGTFENAAVGIGLVDPTGQLLRVNQRCCDILRYSREELLGKNFLDFSHPDDLATTTERFAGLMRGDSPGYTIEKRYVRKDGSPVWTQVAVSLQRDSSGKPAYSIGVIQDISERKRLEEEVRLATARLELALRGSNIGFWDIDMPDGDLRSGRMYYVNMWEQLGYESPTSPTGLETCMVLIHPDDRVPVEAAMGRYLDGETSMFEIECRVRHKDGSSRWRLTRGVAVRDSFDKPIRFLGTCIDITDRKQAEEALRESEERFRQLAENVRGVFWLQEGAWERLLYISPLYEDFWGRTCQSLYDQPRSWIEGVHPEDRDLVFNHFEQQNRGISTETHFRITGPNGSTRWMCCRAFPLKNRAGEVYRVGGLVEDITERRRFEEELRRAKEAAESANRAKDEFLANVSHEIRTPMNAILGMAELTLDTPLTDEQRGNLNIVLSSAEGLLSLINDLLDFSKIESGRLELEEADFSLRTVLNQTLRALALRAHKKGMELACQVEQDVPDGLVGDGNRLRQVLLNLIGNAIKFTEAGEVIVRARAPETDRQSLVIDFEIADTGIGIAPEKQQTIFQAFEQADSSTTRRYGGTGLGLTISSRLVQMMGGTITVESELGRGSTFRFGARFGRSSLLAAAPAQPPVVDLHGLRVLIVDDNATNRTILQGWASAWGMVPTATADVPAAMSALWRGVASKEPFALVLLDARMPGTDGLELAKGISQTPELSACRIILLTSDDRPGDARRYRALRISAVLMKPVQQEELLDNIYRVLSHGAVGTEIAESMRTTAPDTVDEPAATRSLRRLKVLVAEDNKFNQQVIQRMLERRGHTVRVVPNGSETLAALGQSAFDLLLLDVNMPRMDGFEVIRTIREREKTSGNHLRVIALTALSGKRDRERCIEAGMDDFLAKPVRAAEVYVALERVIAVHPIAQPDAPAGSFALIDPAIVLSGCAGDAALLGEMIQLFEEDAPKLLGRVEAAVRSSDAEQLRNAAHSLRGLVSSFSTSAAKAALVLEQLGSEARAGEAAEHYQALNRAVQEVRAILPTLTIEKLRK